MSAQACLLLFFFLKAEDGIRDVAVTGVQTCALPISGVTKRGVSSTKMTPSASAPASTAVIASSRRVIPQTFTRTIFMDSPRRRPRLARPYSSTRLAGGCGSHDHIHRLAPPAAAAPPPPYSQTPARRLAAA